MFKFWLNEFKKFALKGNVIDMAVGIIIGAAFGKIVDSLVKDILLPPISLLMGTVDFGNLFFVLKEGAKPAPYFSSDDALSAGAVILNLGSFLNTLISFLIVAFAVFVLIKTINGIREKLEKMPLNKLSRRNVLIAVPLFPKMQHVVLFVLLIYLKLRQKNANKFI